MNIIRRALGLMLSLAFTMSIYGQLAERTEQVSSANNKPVIIAKDKCYYGGMNYRREIYDNGISVVLDEHDNWYSFKTEYQVNEFQCVVRNLTLKNFLYDVFLFRFRNERLR